MPAEPLRLQFDAFELDEAEARLTREGRPLPLPPRAFSVLCALARRPGQLVTRNDLLDAVWGHQFVSDSALKTTVSELRAALGDDARQPRFIETASRRGYRFIAPTSPIDGAPHAFGTPVAARPALAPPPQPVAPAMIGRHAERERLRAAWREATASRRQIVWIAGEAGIGKTTLIDSFVAEAGTHRVLHGQCVEQRLAGEPYLPVLDALASRCRDDPSLVPLLRAVAPTWLLQMPWLSSTSELEAMRHQLAGSGQERMLREFGELLDQYAKHEPLLLVTEDLHWTDEATLSLMDHVARRRAPARLMWLGSYRLAHVIAEDHPLRTLRRELRLHQLADEVLLDSFSERDVADYVASRLPGQVVSESLARMLHARTDGLPLFVADVVDDVARQGAAMADTLADGPWNVPESLAGLVEAQAERLRPEQRELLEAAAVCGVEFRARTVAEVLGRDPGWVVERCDELARQQHWLGSATIDPAPDGSFDARYGFRHALHRQVLKQRMGAVPLATLHLRIAASLQGARAAGATVSPAELASHFEAGHDVPSALRHHAEAAESALQRFAPAEAMRITDHALSLMARCPDSAARDALEMALLMPRVAATQMLSVIAPTAQSTYERVRALRRHWPEGTSGLDVELGWVHFTGGEYEKALAIASTVLDEADARANPVRYVAACNLLGTTLTYLGQLGEGVQRLEAGIAAFGSLRDRPANARAVVDLEVSMRCRLAQALSHQGRVDAARRHIDEAIERAERLGPYTRRLAILFAGLLEIRLDRPERVLAISTQLQAIADDDEMAQAAGPARWLRGWALARRGEPDAGYELIVAGDAEDARLGLHRGRTAVLGYAAQALIASRQWPQAQARIDDALARAARSGERLYLPDLLLLGAQVAMGRGQPTQARDAMLSAWREAQRQQAAWLELGALVALCEAEGVQPEDGAALAAARARVDEGSGTALLARADDLLRNGRLSLKRQDSAPPLPPSGRERAP